MSTADSYALWVIVGMMIGQALGPLVAYLIERRRERK